MFQETFCRFASHSCGSMPTLFMGGCVCVCVFVLSFSLCRSSSVVVARRCCLSFCRGCLSSSLVVVVGRCCLSLSFVVVVLPLSLSSWSVRPCPVFVVWSLSLLWPLDLGLSTYDLPFSEKAIEDALEALNMCPRGLHCLSVLVCQDQQMPCGAQYAQAALTMIMD